LFLTILMKQKHFICLIFDPTVICKLFDLSAIYQIEKLLNMAVERTINLGQK